MRHRLPFVLMVLFCAFLALPEKAEAGKRGLPLVVINTGTQIAYVADLPSEIAMNPDLQGWSLGYKYERFGILWADVWTWNEELVLFKDDTYSELPEDIRQELEAVHAFSDSDRNIWNRFGVLISVTALFGYALISRRA